MREVLAIIPARGGSKTIPRKNLAPLAGKPLIAWSIDAAHMAQFVRRIVVSTDDPDIKRVALHYGAEVIDRPAALATDQALTDPVMLHVLGELRRREEYHPELTVLLQPTSPIRPVGLIDGCIQRLIRETLACSLFTGFYGPHFVWSRAAWAKDRFKPEGYMAPINFVHDQRKRRQDMADRDVPFFENGTVYVTRTKNLIETGNRVCPPTEGYEMPISESVDIDTESQLMEAESILEVAVSNG